MGVSDTPHINTKYQAVCHYNCYYSTHIDTDHQPYAASIGRFWILLESFSIFSEMAMKGEDDSITR